MLYSGAFVRKGFEAARRYPAGPRGTVPTTVASFRWRAVKDEEKKAVEEEGERVKERAKGKRKGDGALRAGRWPRLTGPPSTRGPGEDENLESRRTRARHEMET